MDRKEELMRSENAAFNGAILYFTELILFALKLNF